MFLAPADKQPITFKLTFSLLEEAWTDTLRFDIARWLVRDDYCSFYTADKPDRIYYVIYTGEGNLMTNVNNQGYFEMQFEVISGSAYTPVYVNTYDLSTPTAVAVTFTDTGDIVTCTAHGMANGSIVYFPTITSTTGITTNTSYYIISATTDTFQLSLTSTGSAITLTTNGSGTMITPTIIQMSNLSNVGSYYMPEIEFTLAGTNTGVKFENLTVGGETLEFAGLTALETVYVNNETKEVLSDVTGSNPLDKCTTMQWIRLMYGVNNIRITGKCTLTVRAQYPVYI